MDTQPGDILIQISNYLAIDDARALSCVSKSLRLQVRPLLYDLVKKHVDREVFRLVGFGNLTKRIREVFPNVAMKTNVLDYLRKYSSVILLVPRPEYMSNHHLFDRLLDDKERESISVTSSFSEIIFSRGDWRFKPCVCISGSFYSGAERPIKRRIAFES